MNDLKIVPMREPDLEAPPRDPKLASMVALNEAVKLLKNAAGWAEAGKVNDALFRAKGAVQVLESLMSTTRKGSAS